ncbi:MAG: protein kinase [Verrucomicrobiae bacterium]|nr:protein kinase [Verrucomicrobiae bacterium]
MPTLAICSHCGAELPSIPPHGFCNRCLFQLGLAAADEPAQEAQAGAAKPAPAAPPPEVAPRWLGGYELLGEIARGGMGVVYRARQTALDRLVAVKVILAGEFADTEQRAQFFHEAQAAARLQHPNIIAIHEVGEHEGRLYFSMDYAQAGNLATQVAGQPFAARRAATLVRTLAEAVQHAHDQGVLHRDLKPSNVLLDRDGRPRLADFGLARQTDGTISTDGDGRVFGSPNFLPPEQAGLKFRTGRASDVYGLGAILYYLLTGRPPFLAETIPETLDLVRHSEPLPPRRLNPSVPTDLATICLKCLEKPPHRRYPDAQALADDLGRFLDGEPVRARPVGAAVRAWRWGRRHPYRAAFVGSLAAGLAVALVLLSAVNRERSRLAALTAELRVMRQEDEVKQHRLLLFLRDDFERLWADPESASMVIRSEEITALANRPPAAAGGILPVRFSFGLMVKEQPTATALQHALLLETLEQGMGELLARPVRLDVRFYKFYPDLVAGVCTGQVDFARLAALPYLRARRDTPALQPLVRGTARSKYAVIFTRPDTGIRTLADVRGRRVAFGETNSTASFHAQIHLARAGLAAAQLAGYEFLDSTYEFAEDVLALGHEEAVRRHGPLHSHAQAIEGVLAGDYDVGVCMEWAFRANQHRGLVAVGDRFESSRTLLVGSPGLPADVARAIIQALCGLKGAWLQALPDTAAGYEPVSETSHATIQSWLDPIEQAYPPKPSPPGYSERLRSRETP